MNYFKKFRQGKVWDENAGCQYGENQGWNRFFEDLIEFCLGQLDVLWNMVVFISFPISKWCEFLKTAWVVLPKFSKVSINVGVVKRTVRKILDKKPWIEN